MKWRSTKGHAIQEQLEHRLQELKTEFAAGQKMLADLEARQAQLRETLLRISGAIQVLEELLVAAPGEAVAAPPVATNMDSG